MEEHHGPVKECCRAFAHDCSLSFISSAFTGTSRGSFHLKLVNFEAHENHVSHETLGLSHRHLVVRRGKPFKVTLLFGGHAWNPHAEVLSLRVWLGTNTPALHRILWSLFHRQIICTQNVCSHPEGDMSEWMPLQLSDNPPNPHVWSAQINPGNCNHSQSIAVHICSPVLSSVGLYHLQLHIETFQSRRTFALGSFVLLFNPWLKGGPHTLPLLSTKVVPR